MLICCCNDAVVGSIGGVRRWLVFGAEKVIVEFGRGGSVAISSVVSKGSIFRVFVRSIQIPLNFTVLILEAECASEVAISVSFEVEDVHVVSVSSSSFFF